MLNGANVFLLVAFGVTWGDFVFRLFPAVLDIQLRSDCFLSIFCTIFLWLGMHPYGDNFHHNFDMIFQCVPSSVETDLFLQREVPFPQFSELDKYWTHLVGTIGHLTTWLLSCTWGLLVPFSNSGRTSTYYNLLFYFKVYVLKFTRLSHST